MQRSLHHHQPLNKIRVLLEFKGKTINERHISTIVESLKKGGVVILPTDSVYAMACDIYSNDAIERICRLKNVKIAKANFSFLFKDISQISEFTKPYGNEVFRLMKASLPGPFTFILNASNKVPGIFKSTNKKTIGVRIPDHPVALAIIEALGNPLMVSSLHNDDDFLEYLTDPEEIDARFGDQYNYVIDGGSGSFTPSTIVDCSGNEPVVVRQGKGIID